jgi:hypothetical protein
MSAHVSSSSPCPIPPRPLLCAVPFASSARIRLAGNQSARRENATGVKEKSPQGSVHSHTSVPLAASLRLCLLHRPPFKNRPHISSSLHHRQKNPDSTDGAERGMRRGAQDAGGRTDTKTLCVRLVGAAAATGGCSGRHWGRFLGCRPDGLCVESAVVPDLLQAGPH